MEDQLGNLAAHVRVIQKNEQDEDESNTNASIALSSFQHPPIPIAHLIQKTVLDSGLHHYQCTKCEYTNEAKDTSAIRDHIRRNHLDIPPLYSCTQCDKKYK